MVWMKSQRIMTSSAFIHLYVLVLAQTTGAQTTNSTSFTFVDFAATTPSSATKVFTTNITLIPKSENQSAVFQTSIFLNATTLFYSSAFPGFASLTIIHNETNLVNQIAISFDVVYQVTYNYTQFVTSATDDTIVTNGIGTLAAVKNGLEASTSLSGLYNVSGNSTSFPFTGNRICPISSCGSSFVFCVESTLGLTPLCRSTCFSNFVCQNSGSCVHRTSTSSPNCNCLSSSSVWYVGGRCEYMVEVWMIVVFVLGFFLVIALIVFVGCMCCRRKPKARKPELPRGSVKTKREAGVGNSTMNTEGSPQNSREPQGYVEDPDPISLYPTSPMTSNALVTVQESSSNESSESSPSVDRREISEAEDVVGQATLPAVSSRSPQREESVASEESENRSEVLLSGVAARSSVADSDDQSRRYNSLQFPDTRGHQTSEAGGWHGTLGATSKGTQTNTRINIELPDSILMNRL